MDAFLLNAAIHAVVKDEIDKGWEVFGIRRGYAAAWSVAGGPMSTLKLHPLKLLPFDLYVLSNAVSCNEADDPILLCHNKASLILFDHQFKGLHHIIR